MYERFLQLKMNIESNEINTIINITMKNLKNHSDYKVILEENDNNFKRKCCVPVFILFNLYFVLKFVFMKY